MTTLREATLSHQVSLRPSAAVSSNERGVKSAAVSSSERGVKSASTQRKNTSGVNGLLMFFRQGGRRPDDDGGERERERESATDNSSSCSVSLEMSTVILLEEASPPSLSLSHTHTHTHTHTHRWMCCLRQTEGSGLVCMSLQLPPEDHLSSPAMVCLHPILTIHIFPFPFSQTLDMNWTAITSRFFLSPRHW